MREIRRRSRGVGNFPDGQSALMLAAARLRYIAGTRWGTRQYMNMERLRGTKVAPSAAGLRIHVPYLHEEGLGGVLAEQGGNVPERWRIVEFYGKNRRFPDCVTYLAAEEDLGRVILFIDRFFANTDRKGASYRVFGSVRW